jgi:hypothetical protein
MSQEEQNAVGLSVSQADGAEGEGEVVTAQTQAAYEALSEVLAQTRPTKTKRFNLKMGGWRGLALLREVSKADVAQRMALLHPSLFDPEGVQRLRLSANAALYVYGMQQDAKALKNEEAARLPKALVDKAKALREEMLAVSEYMLGREPEVVTLLADIRSGSGYADLATDLERLGKVYEAHKAALAKDQVRYRAQDAATARALDGEIMDTLDADRRKSVLRWSAEATKVSAVLKASYEEVAETARWLMRGSPDLAARFPSLFYR